MSNELKPCPFCGTAADEGKFTEPAARCVPCGTAFLPLAMWNRRAPAAAVDAEGLPPLPVMRYTNDGEGNMPENPECGVWCYYEDAQRAVLAAARPQTPEAVARLLKAVKLYASHYMQDEATPEDDLADLVCTPEQHAEAVEVFAAIAAVEAAFPVPRVGGNTNPESPSVGAQGGVTSNEAACPQAERAFELAQILVAGHGKTIREMYCDGEPVGRKLLACLDGTPSAAQEGKQASAPGGAE
jgi:hypothetical protein